MSKERALLEVLACAQEFDATVVEVPSSSAFETLIDVAATSVDGRRIIYRLCLSARGTEVTAREHTPDKLPAFCPQLHINGDGSFCLGWSGDTSQEVVNDESARLWWARLHSYLRMQQRARRLKRWPGREWAHGDAARFQHQAEIAAADLGPDFVRDLEGSKFRASWHRWDHPVHGRMLQVYRDEVPVYRVSERHQRVINGRQACVCVNGNVKRHHRLRNCKDHSKSAFEFALALQRWRAAEEKFWISLAKTNRTCCGRVAECRLNATSSVTGAAT